jgi:hypothetical protein
MMVLGRPTCYHQGRCLNGSGVSTGNAEDVWKRSAADCMSLHGVGGCKAERLGLLRERAVHDRPGPTVTLQDNAKAN